MTKRALQPDDATLMPALPLDVLHLILAPLVDDAATMVALLGTARAFFAVLRPLIAPFYHHLAASLTSCIDTRCIIALRHMVGQCSRDNQHAHNRMMNALRALPIEHVPMLRLYACLWVAERHWRYTGGTTPQFTRPPLRHTLACDTARFSEYRIGDLYVYNSKICATMVPRSDDAEVHHTTRANHGTFLVAPDLPLTPVERKLLVCVALDRYDDPYTRALYSEYYHRDMNENALGPDHASSGTALARCFYVAHNMLPLMEPEHGDYPVSQLVVAGPSEGARPNHFWAQENANMRSYVFRFTGPREEAPLALFMDTRRFTVTRKFLERVLLWMDGATQPATHDTYTERTCSDCGMTACVTRRVPRQHDSPAAVCSEPHDDASLVSALRRCCHGCVCHREFCGKRCSCDCHTMLRTTHDAEETPPPPSRMHTLYSPIIKKRGRRPRNSVDDC